MALAANIAANHPKQGLCQVERLRDLGVPEAHIHTVVDIARHLRDEAGRSLDALFDEKLATPLHTPPDPTERRAPQGKPLSVPVAGTGACCSPTKAGQSCC